MRSHQKACVLLLAALLTIPLPLSTPGEAAENPTTAHDGPVENSTREGTTRAGERNPVLGQQKVLVIAIEFTDVNHTVSLSTFESRISGMNSYYREVSYGNISITGDVAPSWYRSSHTMAYYGEDSGGGNDNANVPIYYLVLEAIDLANPDVNYRDYDTDGDGYLDHLIVVHAGRDQATSGNPNDIWSHRGQVMAYKDGVYITSYVLVSEFSPVSVFCHEFGHDMLLPDLYDYGYDSDGLGVWSLMAAGSAYGTSPAHLDPWCKYYLGWLNPIEVNDNMKDVVIPPVERYPVVYKLRISDTEYFLVENRQQISYDRYLPGRGLLIYHVDESRWSPDVNNIKHWRPNEDENHKFIDIEESTPRQDLDIGYTEGDYNQGDSTDPWLNSEEGFWFGSSPNSTSYYTPWKDSGIAVRNIRASGENMIADLIIQKRFLTVFPLTEMNVEAGPGEAVTFRFEVTSNRRIGDNITVDLRGTHPEWVGPYVTHFDLSGPTDTYTLVIHVTVPPMTLAGYSGRFNVKFISSDGTVSSTFYFNVTVKRVSQIAVYAPYRLNFSTPTTLYLDVGVLSMSNFDEELYLSYQLSGDNPGDFRVSSLPESIRVPPFTWYNFTLSVTMTKQLAGESLTLLKIVATSSETRYTNYTVVQLYVQSLHHLEVDFLTQLPLRLPPGGSGSVTFSVRNTGNVEERLEVLLRPPYGWEASSDPSGRFYVQPGGSRSVTLTITVPEGALYREEGYTVNVTLSGEVTYRLNFTVMVEKTPGIEVEATPSVLRLRPFEEDNVTVSLANTGNVGMTVALRVTDLSRGITCTIQHNPVEIDAGGLVTVNLTLRVKEMLSPGTYSYTFEVYSTQLSITRSLELSVEVLEVVNITTTDFPSLLEVDGSGEGSFWVNNDGNAEVEVILSSDLPSPLQVVFYDQAGSVITSIVIPRGSRALVRFRVVLDGNLPPGTYRGNITLTPTSGGSRYSLPLTINVKGKTSGSESPGSISLIVVLVAIAAVAGGGAGAFIMLRKRKTETPPPGAGDDRKKLAELMGELNRRLEESESVWAKIHRDAALEALNRGDTEKALEEINEAFKAL